MTPRVEYSRSERIWLWTLAVVGFLGINVPFLYGVLWAPEALRAAMTNPVSAAILAEALLLMAALAYLLTRWGVSRLSWRWFVALALLGSMAFALPVVLLWPRADAPSDPS